MAKKQKSGLYRTKIKIGVGPDGKDINKWVSGRTRAELEDAKRAVVEKYKFAIRSFLNICLNSICPHFDTKIEGYHCIFRSILACSSVSEVDHIDTLKCRAASKDSSVWIHYLNTLRGNLQSRSVYQLRELLRRPLNPPR